MKPFVVNNSLNTKLYLGKAVDVDLFSTSDLVGATGRLVFHYTQIANVFTADLQLDYVQIGSNTYDFETSADSFETTAQTTLIKDYNSAGFVDVATGTTTTRVNRDTGGTPSTGTGLTTAASGSYYLYFETSGIGSSAGFSMICRSPAVSIGSDTFSYYEARSGTDMGQLDVYVDVTDVGSSSANLGLTIPIIKTFGDNASWVQKTKSSNAYAGIDLSKGNYFRASTSNDLSVVFYNPFRERRSITTKDTAITFILEINNTGSNTITWLDNIKWHDDATPEAPAVNGVFRYIFTTIDGGSTYYGRQITATV